jgi:hypothetical protein
VRLQIATDAGFSNIVDTADGLTGSSYTPDIWLEPGTTYFWRARYINVCGLAPWSPTWSFTTEDAAPILVVDDDDNSPDVLGSYTGALDALGRDYDVWDTAGSDDEPDAIYLAPYETVIWFTGPPRQAWATGWTATASACCSAARGTTATGG